MKLGLEGRTAIVTGGSRGIGKAIARSFLSEGVTTTITSRDPATAEVVARELTGEGGALARAFGERVELADPDSVAQMVDRAARNMGGVGILVNCGADVSGHVAEDFDHVTDDFVLKGFNDKFIGSLRCARAVAPFMRQARWGRIINIGGHTSRHAGAVAAGARNSALVNLTVALAQALGPYGVTANIVHPATTMTETFAERMDKIARRRGVDVDTYVSGLAAGNALRRLVDASEVADVVTFLASSRAAAVTGEVVAVTGGAGAAVYF